MEPDDPFRRKRHHWGEGSWGVDHLRQRHVGQDQNPPEPESSEPWASESDTRIIQKGDAETLWVRGFSQTPSGESVASGNRQNSGWRAFLLSLNCWTQVKVRVLRLQVLSGGECKGQYPTKQYQVVNILIACLTGEWEMKSIVVAHLFPEEGQIREKPCFTSKAGTQHISLHLSSVQDIRQAKTSQKTIATNQRLKAQSEKKAYRYGER